MLDGKNMEHIYFGLMNHSNLTGMFMLKTKMNGTLWLEVMKKLKINLVRNTECNQIIMDMKQFKQKQGVSTGKTS